MKRFLLSLLIAIPFLSIAQSNFQKGYILTNSGDTLNGYVNYRERSVNPSSVQFKTLPDSKVQNYTLNTSAGYAVSGIEKYQRFTVDISMSSRNISSLSLGPDSSSRRDTVFLKVIREGDNVTLYAYGDEVKTRYYIRENASKVPVELIYERYLDPEAKSHVITAGKYGGQLLDLLIKYQAGTVADTEKLRRVRYEEDDLGKIAAQINKQEVIKAGKGGRTRFFAGTGISVSNSAYSGGHPLGNAAAKSKSSVSPVLTAGIDLFANPAIGKLIYRVELSFVQSKNDISTTTDVPAEAFLSHTFNQYTAMLAPQIIYNVYNSRELKIFAGAGFSANFSKYTNNESTRYNSVRDETTVTEKQVVLEGFSSSFPLRIGAVFSRRVELSAIYLPTSSIAKYNAFSIGMKRYTIGLNYLFG